MAHDVFISYAHEDKPIGDAVCARLEAKGIRCWIAPRDVLPGTDWSEAIVDGINDSRMLVLIYSGNSNESPQVRREIERAVNKGIAIVPFRIEDVPLSKSLEYFISTPHWLDALSQPLDDHIAHLAETSALLLARMDARQAASRAAEATAADPAAPVAVATAPATPSHEPSPLPPSFVPAKPLSRSSLPIGVIAAAIVVVIALVAGVGILMTRPSAPSAATVVDQTPSAPGIAAAASPVASPVAQGTLLWADSSANRLFQVRNGTLRVSLAAGGTSAVPWQEAYTDAGFSATARAPQPPVGNAIRYDGAANNITMDNFAVEARVQATESPDQAQYGVFFTPLGGAAYAYTVQLGARSYYIGMNTAKRLAGQRTTLVNQGSDENLLRMEVHGSTMDVFLNGMHIDEVTEPGLGARPGIVGAAYGVVGAPADGATADLFSSFSVYSLPPSS